MGIRDSFKPGPMGDSGLGQLAYDKGIRILAATQADDVALEDARLGQGLLTYALAVDGLGAGEADVDGDGDIRIDEWLVYAVRRLPTLANDARVGRISAAGNGAVSYTHLDVYKRQAPMGAVSSSLIQHRQVRPMRARPPNSISSTRMTRHRFARSPAFHAVWWRLATIAFLGWTMAHYLTLKVAVAWPMSRNPHH